MAPASVRKGQWSAGERLRRRPAPLYTDPRGMRIPSFVMDQPPLLALADVLADTGELDELARRLPSVRARVSEPALPLVLAALHRRLGRSLICLLPDDEDARDAAEAASWFLGADPVAFMPGRGVAVDSGLRPPPHLVGERLRALSVLENGGLVCISAAAAAEGLPPEGERAAPVEIAVGQASGLEELRGGARPRRLRACRARGGARADRCSRRHSRRLRDDGARADPRRALRRRRRGRPGVLAVHAARVARAREHGRLPGERAQSRSHRRRCTGRGRDRSARTAGRPRLEARRGAGGLA